MRWKACSISNATRRRNGRRASPYLSIYPVGADEAAPAEPTSDPFLVDRLDAQLIGCPAQREWLDACRPAVDRARSPGFSGRAVRAGLGVGRCNLADSRRRPRSCAIRNPSMQRSPPRRNSCGTPQPGRAGKDPRCASRFLSSALALSTLLALQVGHHFRDAIAARWPDLEARARRLVRDGGLLDPGTGTHRRHRGREHGTDARRRDPTVQVGRDASQSRRDTVGPAIDRSRPDRCGRAARRTQGCSPRATGASRAPPSSPAPKLPLQLLLDDRKRSRHRLHGRDLLSLTAAALLARPSYSPFSRSLHVGTGLRFARVRHHHHLSRAISRSRSCRSSCTSSTSRSWCRRCAASSAAAPATSPTR